MLRLARRGAACLGTKYRSFFKSRAFTDLNERNARSVAVQGERIIRVGLRPAIFFLGIVAGVNVELIFGIFVGAQSCGAGSLTCLDARPAFV